jgi:hypothetical protein
MAIETQNVEIDGQPISIQGGNSTAVKVDGSAVTQPVSGTVTATQGTAATLASAWPVEITDGSNVLGTGAHPLTITGTVTTSSNTSNTSTITQVVLTANTNTTLLAANSNRKKFIVFIPKSVTYLKYGVTASATSFTWQAATNNATIDDTIWTGQIDIFSTQAQTVTVTELV